MGLLSIIGRLDLNGAGFQQTLKSSERAADKFAGSVRNKLAGLGAGVFGINALKQMGMAAIENGKEISDLAKKFNLTTDQVQLLQQEAEKTGKPFNDLVKNADELEATLKRIEGGDVIFSEQSVRNLTAVAEVMKTFKDAVGERVGNILGGMVGLQAGAALTPEQQAFAEILAERKRAEEQAKQAADKRLEAEEKIRKINQEAKDIEEKTADEGLTKAERLNKLVEERKRMVAEIAKFPYEPGSEGEANDRLRVAKIDNQIAGLRADIAGATATKSQKNFAPLSDSLTSVGNFLGANPNAETRTQLSEANRTLKSMDRKLSELKNGGSWPL